MLQPELPAVDRSKSALGVIIRDLRLHSVVTLMCIIFLIDEKRRRRRLPGPTTLRNSQLRLAGAIFPTKVYSHLLRVVFL